MLNFSEIKSIEFTEECRSQYDFFMSMQPEELVSLYCEKVQGRVLFLLIVVGLLWLFQPMIQKFIKSNESINQYENVIMFGYKWLGLGLLFMAIYSLWIL